MNEIIVIGKDTIATVIKGAPIAVMISLIVLLFVYYSSKKRITKIDLSKLLLIFYFVEVIEKTIVFRNRIEDPFINIVGNFYLFRWGAPQPETVENIIMFLPIMPLIFLSFVRLKKKCLIKHNIRVCFILPLLVSLLIEVLQAITYRGTFQLSDIFFNTIGGIIGGVIYFLSKDILPTGTKSGLGA